jgi:hypothetical protein
MYQLLTEQPQLAGSESDAGDRDDNSVFESIESWFD